VRELIWVGLCAVIVTGCSIGSQARVRETSALAIAKPLKPPLLPTSFSPDSVAYFRCPKNAGSVVDLEACLMKQLLRLNTRANVQIKKIWRELGELPGGAGTARPSFARAERAWQTYVHKTCDVRGRSWSPPDDPHWYVGGSSAPVVSAQCQVELTRAHIADLKKMAYFVGPH
jgi:uncharacterized protein YecT (DUF1311 family)